MQDFAKT